MAGDLDYGIRITGDATGATAALKDTDDALARVSTSLRQTSNDADLTKAHWDQLNDTHAKVAAGAKLNADGLKSLDDELAVLMSRLDPAYRATKQFQDGQGLLTDGLKNNLITQAQYDGALVSLSSRLEQTGTSAVAAALGTAQARRELIVLGREAMTGNFSRVPGSLMVLSERLGGLGAIFSPLTIGIGALILGTVGWAVAAAKGAAETEAMNNALAVTGDYAGMTRGQMNEMAQAVSDAGTLTIGASKDIVTAIVASGRYGADNVALLAGMVDDYAAVTGNAASKVTPQLIKMFEDPTKASETLNEQYHYLSVAELQRIETLQQTGQYQEAATLALKDFDAGLPKHVENLGTLESAWIKVKQAISGAVDAMLAVGRTPTTQDSIAKLQATIADQQSVNTPAGTEGLFGADPHTLAQNQELLAVLQKQQAAEEGVAAAASVAAQKNQDQMAAQKIIDASETHHLTVLQNELTMIQKNGVASSDNTQRQIELKKQIQGIERSLASEKTATDDAQITSSQKLADISIGSAQNQLETELKLKEITKEQYDEANTGLLLSKNYIEQIAVQRKLDVAVMGQATVQQKLALQLQLQQLQAQAQAIQTKGNNQQLLDENAALAAQQKIVDGLVDGVNKLGDADIQRLTKSIDAQQLHNSEIGKSKEQIDLVKQSIFDTDTAQMQLTADQVEADMVQQEGNADALKVYGAVLDSLNAQIALRQRLSGLMTTGAQEDADAASAKAALSEWNKTWTSVESVGKQAFVAVTANGKNAMTSIGAALKTSVIDLLYELTAKQWLISIEPSVASAFGVTVPPAAGGGASSLSLLSSGANLIGAGVGYGASISSLVAANVAGATGGDAIGTLIAGNAGAWGVTAGTGLASGLMAAVPYVGIGLAIASALGVFGGSNDNAQPAGPPSAYFTNLNGVTSGGLGSSTSNYWTAMGQRKDGGQYSTGPGTYGQWTPAQTAAIDASISSVFASFEAAAKDAGLPTGVLAGTFSSDTSVAHTGATTVAALTSALASLSDSIAAALIPDIKNYQAANETLSQTFTRLIGDVKGVQGIFDDLQNGITATVDVSESLISTFGGLSNLQSQFSTYYNAFYTQAEKDALATKQVADTFASLNEAVPTSLEQFKQLVDSLDLTTASGQTTFKVLMGIASAFNTVETSVTSLAAQITALTQTVASAVDSQISASASAASAAHQSADAYRALAATMLDTITQLEGGSVSSLTGGQKVDVLGANLNDIFQKTLSGDTTAAGKLSQAATDFLTADQAQSATSQAYAKDFARVSAMLGQAGTASSGYAGAMDYQAELLDIQTATLQAIKDQLAQAAPDAAALTQEAGLLSSIRDLLTGQTQQLITVNSSLTDQTGQLITGNAKVDSQTGQIVAVGGLITTQTGQVLAVKQSVLDQSGLVIAGNNLVSAQTGQIVSTTDAVNAGNAQLVYGNSLVNAQTGQIVATTAAVNSGTGQLQAVNSSVGNQTATLSIGNSTTDAIKNLSGLNTSYSEKMLSALVAGTTTQGGSLAGILGDSDTTITLLQQLINLTAQNAASTQAAAAAAAADAAQAAAARAQQQAISQATAAYQGEKAVFDALNLQNTQQLNSIFGAGNWHTITPTDVTTDNPGTISVSYSSQSQLDALSALQPAFVAEVQKVYNLWKAIPGHASGLAVVPHDNYVANLHADEAVLDAGTMSSLRRYGIPVNAPGAPANAELLAEIKALRNESARTGAILAAMQKDTRRTAVTLVRVTRNGDSMLTATS